MTDNRLSEIEAAIPVLNRVTRADGEWLVAQLRAANEALTAACDMLTDADFLSEYQRDLVSMEVAEWRQVLGDTETEEGT